MIQLNGVVTIDAKDQKRIYVTRFDRDYFDSWADAHAEMVLNLVLNFELRTKTTEGSGPLP